MNYLRQSTAYTFRLGPFVDSVDGNTQENALTIAYTDVLLSKAGGALAAKNDTTALTSTGANAHYTCVLNTTDTNTLGALRVWCHISASALPVWKDFIIVPAKIYDSLVAGSDNLEVDTIQWLGTACATPTVNGVPEVDLTHVAGATTNVSALATNVDAILTDTNELQANQGNWLTATGFATSGALATHDGKLDVVDGIVDAILIDTTGLNGDPMRGTDNAALASVCTEGRLAELDAANLPTDVAAIKTDTGNILTDTAEIGVAGAGLTGVAVGIGGIAATSFAVGAIDAASLAADATTEITAGIRIKKNTVLSNFMFLMVDSTDHVTPKTGLTITSTRSIDGAAFAACANSATEVANGMYKINLAATDLNGDVIAFKFTGGATADDRLLTVVTTT